MKTRFSILIPTYNRARFVPQAIDSVLAQNYPNAEVIVIDDGSTDSTGEILASYGTRIRHMRQENQGPEVARNLAAAEATGEYLALLDSDDLFMPSALDIYDRIVRKFKSPPLIIGSMSYFVDGNPLQPADPAKSVEVFDFSDYLSKNVTVGVSSSRTVIRKSFFEQIGGGRNTTPSTFPADDLDLILRGGTVGPCIIVKKPFTVAHRTHDSNTVGDPRGMVKGVRTLLHAERQGKYPGGAARKFERYACLGGLSLLWIRRAAQAGRPDLAFALIAESFPMVTAALWKKFRTQLSSAKQPTVLADE